MLFILLVNSEQEYSLCVRSEITRGPEKGNLCFSRSDMVWNESTDAEKFIRLNYTVNGLHMLPLSLTHTHTERDMCARSRTYIGLLLRCPKNNIYLERKISAVGVKNKYERESCCQWETET